MIFTLDSTRIFAKGAQNTGWYLVSERKVLKKKINSNYLDKLGILLSQTTL